VTANFWVAPTISVPGLILRTPNSVEEQFALYSTWSQIKKAMQLSDIMNPFLKLGLVVLLLQEQMSLLG
jgi:hypothetical protein